MIRTIDHAAYYETRLILMALSLAIAGYFLYYKRDRRYLLMFLSGSFFMALAEYFLQSSGYRGPNYSFSIFGFTPPRAIGPIIQGITEGGACSLLAFWFADLRSTHERQIQWLAFFFICVVVVILGFIAGLGSRHMPVSSIRPMFATSSIVLTTTIIFASLMIAWRKNALSELANFYGGLLLFTFLNLEPLQLTEARYIGVYTGLQTVPVSMPLQIVMMLLSHIFESAGGKLHYFMIPFVFGSITLRGRRESRRRERYSTKHLEDLAQRGWRKRSKPFHRN